MIIRPFVLLEWWDSRASATWLAPQDAIDFSPAVCRSVGWIIGENEDYVALAGTWSPTNDEVVCVITIPQRAIVKRIDLEWPMSEPKGSGGPAT